MQAERRLWKDIIITNSALDSRQSLADDGLEASEKDKYEDDRAMKQKTQTVSSPGSRVNRLQLPQTLRSWKLEAIDIFS